MTYSMMLEITKTFFDTIDFNAFLSFDKEMDVRELMTSLESYYDDNHPELLPKEFQGCIFNFIDEYEFVNYLRVRYGWKIRREVIEKYYINRLDL